MLDGTHLVIPAVLTRGYQSGITWRFSIEDMHSSATRSGNQAITMRPWLPVGRCEIGVGLRGGATSPQRLVQIAHASAQCGFHNFEV